jgi:hypothetical protein
MPTAEDCPMPAMEGVQRIDLIGRRIILYDGGLRFGAYQYCSFFSRS